MTLLPYLRGSGGGGDEPESYTPVEDPNTAQSKATWRVIDLLCEGEIGGLVNGAKSIYLDGVQLQADSGEYNFQGVTWEQRVGTPDQDYLKGFPSVEDSISVGVTVAHGTPVTRTITDTDVDAVRIHLALSALWRAYDNGDLKGSSVQFMIEVVGHSSYTKTITDKFMSSYEVNYRISLPAGEAPWDIRVTKITEDAPDTKSANTINWASYTEIIDHKLYYPDSALIGGSIDASLFGGRIPKRAYELLLLIINVPSNYNPQTRAYTGIWDGTFKLAWSNNPAWCFYDVLLKDRYGLGIPAPDKWALYPIAQYCDEMLDDGKGGLEPRFVLNCLINTAHEAYALINTLASAFRGMPIWSTGSVTAFQDAPDDPQLLASPANVKDGLFSYEGTSRKSRYTVAYVTWNDPANQYKPAIETVVNRSAVRKYGYRVKETLDLGCSRGQANRLGRWLTDTGDAEKETVTYLAGQDHAYAMPGWITAVADPWVANARMGGRLRDGFEAEVLGENVAGDIATWTLLSATREISGTVSPESSTGYILADISATVYGSVTSPSVAYIAGTVFLAEFFLAKDDVSDRVVGFRGINFDSSSYFTVRLRTDTGEYASAVTGGAILHAVAVYSYDHWWRVRIVGSVASGTSLRLRFYPAFGTSLDILGVSVVGSAIIAGAVIRLISGTDYDLLDPRLTLRLDATVTIADGETYLASVVMPDATVEQRSVTNAPGETDVLSLASALSDFPLANSMFVFTGTDVEPRLFRILHKGDNGDGWYKIIAAEHDPDKYARIEQGLVLDTPSYSRDSSSGPVLPPNNPDLLLKTYYADGQLKNMLVFTWEAAADDRVVEYQVEYRVDDGNWSPVSKVPGFLVEKLDVQNGVYYFRVRSVTRTGGTSIWAMDDLEITQATMPDVTGLVLVDGDTPTTFTGGSAKFAWDSVASSEIASQGGTDPWFKSYIVEVRKSGALVRTEYPVIPEYEYTFEKNTANSGPDRSFEIRVYQLGNLGQVSNTPAVLVVSNPAPSMAGFTPSTTDVFKGLRIDWSSWSTTDPDLKSFDLYLDTANPPTTWIATLPSVSRGHVETGLTVGENYNVLIVPRDEFGPGTPSEVTGGTPLILAGADVDVELAESITMSDSLGTAEATLAKLYDRNTTSDGLPRTLGGADQWIQYQFGLATYIDKVILHLADANAQVYFGYSADGETWSWLAAEADHTLDAGGNLVAAASQLAAQGAYLQLDAGLNVAKFPQRVVAKYCRLYLTGTYSTEIYELVFVREVIAEQMVADNLAAISADITGLNTGYMQSVNYTTDAGTQLDLTNGVLHLGGSDGGTTEEGMSFVPGAGMNIVGSITNYDLETGDYGQFTAGGLSFYFADGIGGHFPYKAVRQVIYGKATNATYFTIPGYWRTAPSIFPTVNRLPTFIASSSPVNQVSEVSADAPTEVTTGKWQTRIFARLLTSAGAWGPVVPTPTSSASVSAHCDAAVWAWYCDTKSVSAVATPVNTIQITVTGDISWTYSSTDYHGVKVTVTVYVNGVPYQAYYNLQSPAYYLWAPTTLNTTFTKIITVVANSYSVVTEVSACLYSNTSWTDNSKAKSDAVLSNVRVSANIGSGSVLATGDVHYIAFGND